MVGAPGLALGRGQHLVGDLVEGGGDHDAEIRVGRALGGAAAGHETVVDDVVFRRAVVLDHAHRNVVVGQQQAIGRDERTGTTTSADHRTEGRRGDIGQTGRVTFKAGGLHLRGQIRQLGGHPHAFIGMRGGGQAKGQGDGKGISDHGHSRTTSLNRAS